MKAIDDDLNLSAIVRGLRVFFGLGPTLREVRPGIRRDADLITITDSLLGPRDHVGLDLIVGGGGTINLTTAGPTETAKADHFARGLHRMAFNAIAHLDGVGRTREFAHLRDYVLADVENVAMRAYLIDQQTLNERIRTPPPWTSSCELLRDERGMPQVAHISLGELHCYVSVEPTTHALAAMCSKIPWLIVGGEIDV